MFIWHKLARIGKPDMYKYQASDGMSALQLIRFGVTNPARDRSEIRRTQVLAGVLVASPGAVCLRHGHMFRAGGSPDDFQV